MYDQPSRLVALTPGPSVEQRFQSRSAPATPIVSSNDLTLYQKFLSRTCQTCNLPLPSASLLSRDSRSSLYPLPPLSVSCMCDSIVSDQERDFSHSRVGNVTENTGRCMQTRSGDNVHNYQHENERYGASDHSTNTNQPHQITTAFHGAQIPTIIIPTEELPKRHGSFFRAREYFGGGALFNSRRWPNGRRKSIAEEKVNHNSTSDIGYVSGGALFNPNLFGNPKPSRSRKSSQLHSSPYENVEAAGDMNSQSQTSVASSQQPLVGYAEPDQMSTDLGSPLGSTREKMKWYIEMIKMANADMGSRMI